MISGSDLELKKLSEESGSGLDEDDKDTKAVIDNFMDLFRKDNGIG
jgi:hypothetical protein